MHPAAELGVAVLLKALVEAVVYRRLAPSIAKIILLILVSLSLLAACCAVLLYQLYILLVAAGLAQQQALAVLGGGMLAFACLSAIIALRQLQALHARLQPLSVIKPKIIKAARAFSEGMQTPSQ